MIRSAKLVLKKGSQCECVWGGGKKRGKVWSWGGSGTEGGRRKEGRFGVRGVLRLGGRQLSLTYPLPPLS